MKKSIWGLLVLSGLLMADFVRDDAKEVVNDTTTCLMWQDNNASKTVIKSWQEAIDYCEELTFAGYDDWRLPNFNELYSISDRSRVDPAIQTAFSNVIPDVYWSSTSGVSDARDVWIVHFVVGVGMYGYKLDELYVRCVRGGK